MVNNYRMKLKILRTIVISGIRTVADIVGVAMSTIRTGGRPRRRHHLPHLPGEAAAAAAIAAGGIRGRDSESHLPSRNRSRNLRDRVTTNRHGDSILVWCSGCLIPLLYIYTIYYILILLSLSLSLLLLPIRNGRLL